MLMFEYEWVIRLLVALAAGTSIGFERQHRAKEAGIRTHATVALASCLIMLISKYGFKDIGTGDPGRVAASVVTGVGFLGAGVIFVRHEIVQGLTTAAGVWATSAIGLAFGSGMYVIGVISTLLMYVVQHILYRYFPHNNISMILNFRIHMNRNDGLTEIMDILTAHRFHPMGETRLVSDGEGKWCLSFDSITHKNPYPGEMIEKIKHLDGVLSVEIL